MLSLIPAPRQLNLLALLACIAAMAGALYLQHVDGLEPCPLCIFQRIGVIAAALILLIATLHGPQRTGVRIYGALTGLAAIAGGAVSIRHIWLQNLPPDQVPSCILPLDYMLETLPLWDVLSQVLSGTAQCAEVTWTFLGLSIAEGTLIAFICFTLFGVMQLVRKVD
ncbi:disulfide bond formation protein B [uncultured Alcanivorax sp.]|uniref:disulfide bond formation protein B n=1 Tax=uncultured Alcanivorax sp. TaxID=191215 RepID=UPI002605D4FD|nr:disulfide bond formation protein B [uncultured Alcanivorax sp.]